MKNLVGEQDGRKLRLWSDRFRLMKWRITLLLAPGASIRRDWRAGKYFPLAMLLLIWTSLVVAAYYLNHPQVEPLADSWSYLYVVDQIQQHGRIVNFWRLPGYPLLIWMVYGLAGQGNLGAVSVAQGALFVLSVLEFYILSALLLRRAWLAFLLSLLVGTNIVLLSYVKPIMSEGMALWLLVTLALAVTLFLHAFRLRFFWLVVFCMFFLFFTRPEWIYLPPFLFAYLLLAACWRGAWRRLLAPSALALLLLYGCLGGYVLLNAAQNQFTGVTWIQNINLLGKVLQYRMVDEAAPQDMGIAHILDAYLKRGITDPYIILSEQPALARDYATRSGAFAKAIILHHPLEFLLKSVPVFFSSLTYFHLESQVLPGGPFGVLLLWLTHVFRRLYNGNILFPLCALVWALLLCRRSIRRRAPAQAMGVLVLLALYGLAVTVLAGYRTIDYARIYTVLEPLLLLTIGGTLLAPFPLTRASVVSARREQNDPAGTVAPGNACRVPHRGQHLAPGALMYRIGVLLLLCLILLIGGGPTVSAFHVAPRLIPLRCHAETGATMLRGTGVGILFITIENRGQDVGPSTMQITYQTGSSLTPRVTFEKAIQALPAGAYRYIMVDLPRTSQGDGFLDPIGPVTISLDVAGESRSEGILVTNC